MPLDENGRDAPVDGLTFLEEAILDILRKQGVYAGRGTETWGCRVEDLDGQSQVFLDLVLDALFGGKQILPGDAPETGIHLVHLTQGLSGFGDRVVLGFNKIDRLGSALDRATVLAREALSRARQDEGIHLIDADRLEEPLRHDDVSHIVKATEMASNQAALDLIDSFRHYPDQELPVAWISMTTPFTRQSFPNGIARIFPFGGIAAINPQAKFHLIRLTPEEQETGRIASLEGIRV